MALSLIFTTVTIPFTFMLLSYRGFSFLHRVDLWTKNIDTEDSILVINCLQKLFLTKIPVVLDVILLLLIRKKLSYIKK